MPTTGADAALPIETARLRLRLLQSGDAAIIERLAGDWEVARFTGSIPHPYPPGGAAPWIEETRGEAAAGRKLVAAVQRRDDGAFLGCVEIDMSHGPGLGVLGYWIGRPYWGAGVASEAAKAMVEIAFSRLGLERIEAVALPANRRSIGVLEKLGLRLVGEREEPAPARGGPVHVEVRRL